MVRKKYSKRLGRNVWGFDVTLADGRRIRQYHYDDRQSAADALLALKIADRERRLGIGNGAAPDRPLLATLIQKRLASIVKRSERVRSMRVLNDLLSVVPKGIFVDEMTSAHIRAFVEKRQADEVSASSINRELNIIAATLHAAATYFPSLAQWVAPRMPRPKSPRRGRERLISEEELRELLAWLLAPPKLGEQKHQHEARVRVGHILHWACLTGMRHGEINRLRWADVDTQGNQIKVVGTKTDAVRYLIITPTMQEILSARKKAAGRSSFIFNQGGNTGSKFYKILRQACDYCGIPYGRRVLGGLTLHDARHTVTTRLIQGGIDLATIGSITGHRDKTLILYYSHATPASRQKAAEIIEQQTGADLLERQKKKTG